MGSRKLVYAKTKQTKERYDKQKKQAKQTYEVKKKQAKADYYRKEKEAKETYYLKQGQAKQAYYRSAQKGAEPLQPRNSTEEIVKHILVQLAPGSEVYGLAEIVAEALDSGPVFLAESWNKKFVLADAMSAPLIEPAWAQTNKTKMIALDIALKPSTSA